MLSKRKTFRKQLVANDLLLSKLQHRSHRVLPCCDAMASLPASAPSLPRAPTAIRKPEEAAASPPLPNLPPPAAPPRFPSLSDVGLGSAASAAAAVSNAATSAAPPPVERRRSVAEAADMWGSDIPAAGAGEEVDMFAPEPAIAPSEPVRAMREEWTRKAEEAAAAASASASASASTTARGKEAAPKGPGALASIIEKVKAMLKPKEKTPEELEREARIKAETKPALVKAKEAICKMPDPTLLFTLLLIAILLVHNVRPAALKTWTARILVPLTLVPTVAASALWRRTRVISLKPDEKILSAAAPFPNAGLLVTKGEKLRERESAVEKAEADLLAAQRKLEVQRKEVESRLPPHVDVAVDAATGSVRRTQGLEGGSSHVAA